jgi:hypothetical protein
MSLQPHHDHCLNHVSNYFSLHITMFICSRPSEIVWVKKYSTHVLYLDTDLWINWILGELKAGD